MGPIGRAFLGLCAFQAAYTSIAWACSCRPTTAEEAIASGDPIVVADVTSTRSGCSGNTRVTIDVQEVIAGTASLGEMQVFDNRSTSCSLGVQEGETWILQIFNEDRIALCDASQELEGEDDPWLAELRAAAAE